MQEKPSQSDIQEMLDICLSGYQGSKQVKQYKQICIGFFKQIIDSENTKKKQDTDIQIIVCSDEKNTNQRNQSIIMGCLLFFFLKYRYLKVTFEVYSKQQLKSINREKNIILNLHKFELTSKFYNKICGFISKKQRQYHHSFYFFKELCFKAKSQNSLKFTNEIAKARLNCYQMIHQFYKQLSYIMTNKKIYLMKNTIGAFVKNQIKKQQEKICFQKIMEKASQIYSLVHIFIDLPQPSLLNCLNSQRKQIGQAEIQITQNQKTLDVGVFKQFMGSTLQYLQKLVIVTNGQIDEITNVTNFLLKTPNLSYLQIHNKTRNQIILPGVQKLLEVIVEHVPFIKKINIIKFTTRNIQLELLHRLYVNCPYLVDLSIGLTFQHSITETYQISNFQNKKALELQREKLFINYALRMRNITLNNSFQTVKLLLKKGYNFLSALQILECIQSAYV